MISRHNRNTYPAVIFHPTSLKLDMQFIQTLNYMQHVAQDDQSSQLYSIAVLKYMYTKIQKKNFFQKISKHHGKQPKIK